MADTPGSPPAPRLCAGHVNGSPCGKPIPTVAEIATVLDARSLQAQRLASDNAHGAVTLRVAIVSLGAELACLSGELLGLCRHCFLLREACALREAAAESTKDEGGGGHVH